MTAPPEITVDLALPPQSRWEPLQPHRDAARALFDLYLHDLGDLDPLRASVAQYRRTLIAPELAADVAAVAALTGFAEEDVLLVNLTYDLTKLLWGCTAFAVDTTDGPLHARNLDWWTQNGLLSRNSLIINYRNGRNSYRVVGWPGFVGALSGVAPGRFAVTLNAVQSADPPQPAPPITFLLRAVLETAATYAEAVETLTTAPIAGDCLLLVTGNRPGEMVVIERTPRRAAVRHPDNGFLVVANDYRALAVTPDAADASGQELQMTSCGRYDRVHGLLSRALPQDSAAALDILHDPGVQVGMTVQQMALSAAQGTVQVSLPPAFPSG